MTIGKLERKNEYALSRIKLIHTSLFRISARLPSKSDIIVCGLNDILICAALLRNSLNKNLYVLAEPGGGWGGSAPSETFEPPQH